MNSKALVKLYIAVLGCLSASFASADHEPFAYSFSGARSRTNAIEFKPSPIPRFLARDRVGSDPLIQKKMDELLNGWTATGLAGIAVEGNHILYEKYKRDDERNLYPAWSMTKSLVALSVGHALCDSHINSLDDPAEQYLPNIRDTVWGRATIRQLLKMQSGSPRQALNSGGDYQYPGISSGQEMIKGILSVEDAIKRHNSYENSAPAGSRFTYSNMDTDTLSLVVAAAARMPYGDYFDSTVLKGAKLEHISLFHVDSRGHPVAHAYFFATLRDFARLGQYVLDLYQGKVGTQCLRDYVVQAVTPYWDAFHPINKSSIGYGYQFWVDTSFGISKNESVRMSGHQGQDIFINLRTGKVAVVLGWRGNLRDKSYQANSISEWMIR